MIGIYKIENVITKKVYIGQSNNIDYRFKCHKAYLRHNHHFNQHLQKSWNKYKEENFVFSVIEECSQKELNDKETYWCDYYKPNVYNLGITGNVGTMSDETKLKISNSLKGRKLSPEQIEKNRLGHIGIKRKPLTREQIEKHRAKMKNRHLSPATEFKKGHIMEENVREKISKAMKGRSLNDEWRKKISIAKMGHSVSEETRKKISINTKIGMQRRKNLLEEYKADNDKGGKIGENE